MRRSISKHIRLIVPSLHKSCENFILLVRAREDETRSFYDYACDYANFSILVLNYRVRILTGVPESPESPFLPLQLNIS